MIDVTRDVSSGGYISLNIKQVSLPRREILSPAGSIASDALPSSEMYSY